MANEENKPINQGPVITGQASLQKWSQLLKQVWADEQLKQRLLDKPAAVLQEHGIEVPAGVEIRVVENTDKVSYVTLPAKPAGDVTELTSNQLASIVGAVRARPWDPPFSK
jgi:hypothetical protein